MDDFEVREYGIGLLWVFVQMDSAHDPLAFIAPHRIERTWFTWSVIGTDGARALELRCCKGSFASLDHRMAWSRYPVDKASKETNTTPDRESQLVVLVTLIPKRDHQPVRVRVGVGAFSCTVESDLIHVILGTTAYYSVLLINLWWSLGILDDA